MMIEAISLSLFMLIALAWFPCCCGVECDGCQSDTTPASWTVNLDLKGCCDALDGNHVFTFIESDNCSQIKDFPDDCGDSTIQFTVGKGVSPDKTVLSCSVFLGGVVHRYQSNHSFSSIVDCSTISSQSLTTTEKFGTCFFFVTPTCTVTAN